MTTVLWFRRDLRLDDHPALLDALHRSAGQVLGLFVVDQRLWGPAGPARRSYLRASLRALDQQLSGRLCVRQGDPEQVVVQTAVQVGATCVHVSADYGPYGRRRDARVAAALHRAGVLWRAGGSPYAVDPGGVQTKAGGGFSVFTPFQRAWRRRGWDAPSPSAAALAAAGASPWLALPGDGMPPADAAEETRSKSAGAGIGERCAWDSWDAFRDGGGLTDYARSRDRPDLAGTSRLSAHLRWGEIHPRDVAGGCGDGARLWSAGLRHRAGLARALRRRPATASGHGTAVVPPGDGTHGAGPTPPAAARLAGGTDRLPVRRRGDAPASRGGLEARPAADADRLVPGQGPPPALAAWCALVPPLAGGWRPRLQPARVAVGGWLGHRRGPVLPDLQPGRPGPTTRSGRGVRPALRPRAAASAGRPRARAVASLRRLRQGIPVRVVGHAEERAEALRRYAAMRGHPEAR